MKLKTGIALAALASLTACGSGGDGETVIARDGDTTISQGADGNATITTAEGTTRIRTGGPVGALPGGLPPYPNAQAAGGVDVSGAGAGGEGRVVMFTTTDQPARVIDFYSAAAGRAGMETEARVAMGPTSSLSLRRGEEQVTVTAIGAEGATQVQVASGG